MSPLVFGVSEVLGVLVPGLWRVGCATELGRPLLVVDPWDPQAHAKIRDWLSSLEIGTLNVAGLSERGAPGVGERVYDLLTRIFADEGVDR